MRRPATPMEHRSVRAALVLATGLCTSATSPCLGQSCDVMDLRGYGWQTGSFPVRVVGDTMNLVFRADVLAPRLGLDLLHEEVTGWVTGLVCQAITDPGFGYYHYVFSDGTFSFHHDPDRDSDYGILPPNATVPSTFIDGTVCLKGFTSQFELFYDGTVQTGSFECWMNPASGDCIESIDIPTCSGLLLYGVIEDWMQPPDGYDFHVDAIITQYALPWYVYLPCFALASADFQLASDPAANTDVTAFFIRGAFTEGTTGRIDPTRHSVAVSIGSLSQSFGARSLVRAPEDDRLVWRYADPETTGAVTMFEMEPQGERRWEFRIGGRGVPVERLIGGGRSLEVSMMPAPWYVGETRVILDLVENGFRYRAPDPRPCPTIARAPAASSEEVFGSRWGVELAPNPSRAATTVLVRSPAAAATRIAIFDLRGALLRTLYRGLLRPGEHRFVWDGRDARGSPLPSGVYFCRVDAAGSTTTKKLVVVR